MSEHLEQAAFFDILRLNERRYPFLKWVFAIPNGGARHVAVATKLKAEGVKKGVWDIFVPIPSDSPRRHGLFIEMKYGANKLTAEQEEFKQFIFMNLYAVRVCYNWQEAVEAVEDYLNIRLTL